MEGGRKERWGGRGRNKYFIGVGNRSRTEGVAGSGEALAGRLAHLLGARFPGSDKEGQNYKFPPVPCSTYLATAAFVRRKNILPSRPRGRKRVMLL